MELGLRLGSSSSSSSSPFRFSKNPRKPTVISRTSSGLDFSLGFSSLHQFPPQEENHEDDDDDDADDDDDDDDVDVDVDVDGDGDSPFQLDLLPRTPLLHRRHSRSQTGRITDVTIGSSTPAATAMAEGGGGESSFEVEFYKYRTGGGNGMGHLFPPASENSTGAGMEVDEGGERGSCRASDEDDQSSASRKKLRLSREQSAFLEESFKEHHTLYPKQKLELARRLNLRPRQVEVWFQNRRARTKLKQTEVDCEYLKKCCETLTQENRKLQKELQDLRALKTTDSLYMHSPATTLTMCPSCERVAATASTGGSAVQPPVVPGKEPPPTMNMSSKASGFSFPRRPLPIRSSSSSFPFPH